ncbi:LysR family transcriptional regulator [Kordiimonas laminariae]|nr:LysR family transcriptional regulator [Kordiimonas laminariae]MCK0069674.1 LysR family transcriptional regulator [Kordiimonas laminariae]
MMNLNDMVLFAKVAECKGISSAAKVMNIPKSRVSRRIATLEEALGTRLLERTTRAIELTEMGTIFLPHCKRIAEEAESALESINRLQEAPRGVLRVSASVGTGQYLIAPYLGEFMAEYPEVNVELDLTNRRVDLITEGYDLVIRVGELEDSTLMSKKLGNARAVMCASPDYLKEHGNPTSIRKLGEHKKIVMSSSNNTTEWVLESTSGELQAIDVKPAGSVNDFTSLRSVAEQGGGIALMPEYVIADALQAKRLVRVLPDWRSKLISYYILYPSRKGLTKKAEAWISFFTKRINAA